MEHAKAESSLTLGPVRHRHGDKGHTQPCTEIKGKGARSIHYGPVGDKLQMHNVVFEDTPGVGTGFHEVSVVPFGFRSVSFFFVSSSSSSSAE